MESAKSVEKPAEFSVSNVDGVQSVVLAGDWTANALADAPELLSQTLRSREELAATRGRAYG